VEAIQLRSDVWLPNIIRFGWTPRVVKYSEDEERNSRGEWFPDDFDPDSELAEQPEELHAPKKLLKYDDDEERDYHGRWTSGDGGDHIGSQGTDFRTIVPEIEAREGWHPGLKQPRYGENPGYAALSYAETREYDARIKRINADFEQEAKAKYEDRLITRGVYNEKTGSTMSTKEWTDLRDTVRGGGQITPEMRANAGKEQELFAKNWPDDYLKAVGLTDEQIKARGGYDSRSPYNLAVEEAWEKRLLIGQAVTRGGLVASDYPNGIIPFKLTASRDEMNQHPGKGMGASLAFTDDRMTIGSAQSQKFVDGLTKEMQNSEPTIRISSSGLNKVLTDGAFKAAGETGKTGAPTSANEMSVASYTDYRAQREDFSMSVPKDADPSQRPVYGFMASKTETDAYTPTNIRAMSSEEQRNLLAGIIGSPYAKDSQKDYEIAANARLDDAIKNPGNYRIIDGAYRENGHKVTSYYMRTNDDYAKELTEARDNTRYGYHGSTGGLSRFGYTQQENMTKLASYPLAGADGKINADLFSALTQQNGSATAYYGDARVTLKSDILSNATVTNGDSLDDWWSTAIPAKPAADGDPRVGGMGFFQGTEFSETGVNGSYLELQMYQHPTIGDIARVDFTGRQPPPGLLKKLEANGIPFNIDAPALTLKQMGIKPDDFLPPTKKMLRSFIAKK